MTIRVTVKDNTGDYLMTNVQVFERVWELQDNDGSFIVIKFHNHECELINKDEIENIEVSI